MASGGFGIVDFLIFVVSLLLSASIGIFYAVKNRKQKNGTSEFFLGNRQMPVIPTALSILTSFLSGILLLAIPAEVYEHGALIWIYMLAGAFSMLFNGIFFLPILYGLKPISVYEYFLFRFNSNLLRRFASVTFILNSLIYVAVAMYAPAVALSGVTNVPTWIFIVSVGFVCTFYTTLGGLKAVVWADTLQAILMYSGVIALVAKTVTDIGGFTNIFELAIEHGRISPLENLDPNPLQYLSIWIASFGGFSFWLGQYGLNQIAVQRYCSLPSLNQARLVISIVIPCYIVLGSLCCFVGLILLAHFHQCDPRNDGQVTKKDQLVIYLVARSLGTIPGLPGLFLACLCSGTLSTVSSGINSVTAVLWQDFLKDFLGRKSVDLQSAKISKWIALCFGIAATGLSFLCGPMGGLLKSATNFMGTLAGPIVGLFALGIFVPRANKNGALVSFAMTMIFLLWICYGNVYHKPFSHYRLPIGNYCMVDDYQNETETNFDWRNSPHGDTSVFFLYRIAPWLYPTLGIILVVVLGTIASILLPTKPNNEVDKKIETSEQQVETAL